MEIIIQILITLQFNKIQSLIEKGIEEVSFDFITFPSVAKGEAIKATA